MKTKISGFQTQLDKLSDIFEEYLVDKAPFTLPKNIKETIVNFGPYIALIITITAIPAILLLLGVGTFIVPLSFMVSAGMGYSSALATIVLAVALVMNTMAIPGLFKKDIKAWNLLYYAALVQAVHSLIIFDFVGLIIGSLITFYILFQVKGYYK